jgi:hypothetical protein
MVPNSSQTKSPQKESKKPDTPEQQGCTDGSDRSNDARWRGEYTRANDAANAVRRFSDN